jgi:Ca2+-binding RTX toxin-like protein
MTAVVTLGYDGERWGTFFLYNVINLISTDGVTVEDISDSEKTIALTYNELEYKADLHGTNVTSDGTVDSLTLYIGGNANITISGLNIAATDISEALDETDPDQRHLDCVNLFKGTDWQADLSTAAAGGLVFGSGGNDQFTLGSTDDVLMLDGGNDNSSMGAGDDFIYARNIESYSAAGTSTIDGGDGNDTFALDTRDELSGVTGAQKINLFAKGRTVDLTIPFVDGDAIAKLLNIENLRGSQFNDKLLGDNGANTLEGEEGSDTLIGRGGWDTLIGDDGNDKLIGGRGGDRLTGGAGADRFIYTSAKDSVVALDAIMDFQRKQDRIDLSGLPLPKDAEFAIIGDHKFGHHAGEIQIIGYDYPGRTNDYLMLGIDLDGDAKADLQIYVDGPLNLGKDDFIF